MLKRSGRLYSFHLCKDDPSADQLLAQGGEAVIYADLNLLLQNQLYNVCSVHKLL